jgi:SHS2 domain-containing protein
MKPWAGAKKDEKGFSPNAERRTTNGIFFISFWHRFFNGKRYKRQAENGGEKMAEKYQNLFYNQTMPHAPKPYRLLDHTADLGMECRGKDLTDLFEKAARSFFDLMIQGPKINLHQENLISLEAPDQEALLVAWLSELLYLFETGPLVLGQFTIQRLTPTSLQARVQGEYFDPRRHQIKQAVKAVTYHQLRIWKEKTIWKARIFFDL